MLHKLSLFISETQRDSVTTIVFESGPQALIKPELVNGKWSRIFWASVKSYDFQKIIH
jgi:hypothetical protein